MSFYKRVAFLTLSFVIVLTIWQLIPFLEILIASKPKPITPRGELNSFEKLNIEIFEKNRDSVVFISTLEEVIDYWTLDVFSIPKGTGSGFIWDEFGHIITNYHVIKGASQARVRLSNGQDYKAVLVGADPMHDLAVLKIKPVLGVMKPVAIGSSKDLKVGQFVYAIGNPFGLDWTMTIGIISALDRVLYEENGVKIKHIIQTDAAINPGNSGGPLLDSAGRVIGVNTAIYSPSGANAGIGFAIPIDLVNRVVSQLIAYGKYIRPTLGIESDDRVNLLLKKRFGIEGVAVLGFQKRGRAREAKLKPAKIYPDGSIIFEDIIVGIDGKKIKSLKELEDFLDEKSIGDEVIVEILRGRDKIKVPLVLE